MSFNHDLKQSLRKYAQTELLLLSEAAVKLKMSEDYLRFLARRGKIKAFKVGDDWLVEESWLNDFRQRLKHDLHHETFGHGLIERRRVPWAKYYQSLLGRAKTGLSRYLKLAKFKHRHLPFFHKLSQKIRYMLPVYLVYAGVALLGMSLFLVPLSVISQKRQAWARGFLVASHRVYQTPLMLCQRLTRGEKIDDEILTAAIYKFLGLKHPRVAGEFESGSPQS